MATTFEVIAATEPPITADLLRACETRIGAFLGSVSIRGSVSLRAELIEGNKRRVIDHEPFVWATGGAEYLWISIDGVPGGIDTYCQPIIGTEGDDDRYLLQAFREPANYRPEHEAVLARAVDRNMSWTFRRSAGQRAVTSLCYGLIAATLAEMTGGLVLSNDGAWDYQRFPAEGAEMLEWYFQPEKALSLDFSDWAARCLADIRETIAPSTLHYAPIPHRKLVAVTIG